MDGPIRVWCDTAGFTHDFPAQICALRADTDTDDRAGLDIRFSVGVWIDAVIQAAIVAVPEDAWSAATRPDGTRPDGRDHRPGPRDHPRLVRPLACGYAADRPQGAPHPGAKLTLWEAATGWRHQVVATDIPASETVSAQREEAEHRQHAVVEDRMRQGKQMDLRLLPSRLWHINTAWLVLVVVADQFAAATRLLGFDQADPMRNAEIKGLRYRILHVPGRRSYLHLPPGSWPSLGSLRTAWARICAIPIPAA
ncbi:transposase [Glycomyces salinus]|uniref:transposase n=1 Tax=Glycomyces salinus TaxID=980294 RepID=UPI0018ED7924|nr:transposase [Glycomyces salinus]